MRGTATVVAGRTARRALRSGVVWGLLFGGLAANEALSYTHNFPTLESRTELARTIGTNAGLAAVTGVGHRLDTIEGFVAWRVFGLLVIVGAIWGLLTATRLLRGEEDAGRWELLLAGRTTRRTATGQALVGLGAGFAALWAVTSIALVVAGTRSSVGFTLGASWFYATALVAGAAIFLAVGAVTSQLGTNRRHANGLGAAVLAGSLVVRAVADSADGLGWLRWLSPLGWVENLRPLTGSAPWALVPIAVLVGACVVATLALAERRDVGAGALARPQVPTSGTRLLDSPLGLVVRLERWVLVAWAVGLGALAAVFGVVARTAGTADIGNGSLNETVTRLGGQAGGSAAWLGYEFLYIAPLVAFAAAGQIAAMRHEEAGGHLDNLLARPVSRTQWAAGRLGFGVVLVAATGLACALGGWLGTIGGSNAIPLGRMLQAGANTAAPAVAVLGIGALLYGLVPRIATPVLYAVILWSFVVEVVGSSLTTNRWVLDSSLLSHLTPVPAAPLRWSAVAWLVGLGLLAAAAGVAALARRDVAGE